MSEMRKILIIFQVAVIALLSSCGNDERQSTSTSPSAPSSSSVASASMASVSNGLAEETQRLSPTKSNNHIDSLMTAKGLVDLQTLGAEGISVDLRYATPNNFVGEVLYDDLRKAYAERETAKSLLAALSDLRAEDPAWGIVVYDAARPISVQRRMYDKVKNTNNARYVARPTGGGPHNYGMALDISLTYNGKPVDMGTEFDTFDERAHITAEDALVERGLISAEARDNRRRLRRAMTRHGFGTFSREWWHFTRYDMKYTRSHLPLLYF